jgi:hypothetical protein
MYGRDADDTLDWIQEKDGVIASEDFGHDFFISLNTTKITLKIQIFEVCDLYVTLVM